MPEQSSSAMKVAICAPMDLGAPGGVETSVIALAGELRELGVEADVFGRLPAGGDSSLPAYCYPLGELRWRDYDIIHTQGAGLWWGLACQLGRRSLRGRLVHTLHGVSVDYARACGAWLNWRTYTATFSEGVLSRAATEVITVSEGIRRRAVSCFRLRGEKVTAICNGHGQQAISAEQRQAARERFGVANDEIVIVFVGRGGDRVKGTAAIAEALTQLHAEGLPVRLLAAPGDGFAAAAWLTATGRWPYERMGEVYAAGDVFVNASLNEGMPLTLLEALGAGLAVVAAPVGGIPEVVRDEENGLLSRQDRGDLADCLRRVVQDAGLRERLGAAGQETAAGLRWRDCARKTLEVYEKVVLRNSGG